MVQRAPADEKWKIYAEARLMICITGEGRALPGLWCRIRDRVMSRTQLKFISLWANLSLGFSRTASQQGALSACKRVHECIFGGRSSYTTVLLCLSFFLLALSFYFAEGGLHGFRVGQRGHSGRVPESGETDLETAQPAIGGQVQHRVATVCVPVSAVSVSLCSFVRGPQGSLRRLLSFPGSHHVIDNARHVYRSIRSFLSSLCLLI